jgi:hypothetical protein
MTKHSLENRVLSSPSGSPYAVQRVAMVITILNWLKFVNASVDPLLAEQVIGSGFK